MSDPSPRVPLSLRAQIEPLIAEMRGWEGCFGPRTERQLFVWADALAAILAPAPAADGHAMELVAVVSAMIKNDCGPTANYCWWCDANINGLNGGIAESHIKGCLYVRAKQAIAALASPQEPQEPWIYLECPSCCQKFATKDYQLAAVSPSPAAARVQQVITELERCQAFNPLSPGSWTRWIGMLRKAGEGAQTVSSNEHFSVSVERSGENVVTIDTNCLSGRDLQPGDEAVIEHAAQHLLAFIGRPAPAAGSETPEGFEATVGWIQDQPETREWPLPVGGVPLALIRIIGRLRTALAASSARAGSETPDAEQIFKDAAEITSSYGFLLMRLAVAADAQDTFDVCKREFTEHEPALKRLQEALLRGERLASVPAVAAHSVGAAPQQEGTQDWLGICEGCDSRIVITRPDDLDRADEWSAPCPECNNGNDVLFVKRGTVGAAGRAQEEHICRCGSVMVCPDIGCDRNKGRGAALDAPEQPVADSPARQETVA